MKNKRRRGWLNQRKKEDLSNAAYKRIPGLESLAQLWSNKRVNGTKGVGGTIDGGGGGESCSEMGNGVIARQRDN